MLYEFAILPDVFKKSSLENDDKGKLLYGLLSDLKANGLLANLHRDKLYEHIQDILESEYNDECSKISPKVMNRILENLIWLHARKRFVRHPKSKNGYPEDDRAWLELALKSHDQNPFKGIILGKKLWETHGANIHKAYEFTDVKLSPEWENIGKEESIKTPKTISAYRKLLAPVLRYAKSLHLVDYYFNFNETSGYPSTLRLCADLLGKRIIDGKESWIENRTIFIHASYYRLSKNSNWNRISNAQDWYDGWKTIIKSLKEDNKCPHTFKLILWEDPKIIDNKSSHEKEMMHLRYILTDQCGISSDYGLECHNEPYKQTTEWSRLSDDDWNKEQDNCNPEDGKSKYGEPVDAKEYPW